MAVVLTTSFLQSILNSYFFFLLFRFMNNAVLKKKLLGHGYKSPVCCFVIYPEKETEDPLASVF